MTILDFFEIPPAGLEQYLNVHGHHFSKPMLEWAVGLMSDSKGNSVTPPDRKELDEFLEKNNVRITRTAGYYDPIYVWCMGQADFDKAFPTEAARAAFVKAYIDDPDDVDGRAFDEFFMKAQRNEIDIPWEDLI